MADSHHSHYTRGSTSPITTSRVGLSSSIITSDMDGRSRMPEQLSPPRPTPSSRMALSALVNSPPTTRTPLSPPHNRATYAQPPAYTYPPITSMGASGVGSTSTRYVSPVDDMMSGYAYTPSYALSDRQRPESSTSAQNGYSRDAYDEPTYTRHSQSHSPQKNKTRYLSPDKSQSRYVSPPPLIDLPISAPGPSRHSTIEPDTQSQSHSRNGRGFTAELRSPKKGDQTFSRVLRPDDRLTGNEELWEVVIKIYQKQREDQVDQISLWADTYVAPNRTYKKRKSRAADELQDDIQADSANDESVPKGSKRKGVTDQSGAPVTKRKYVRKSRGKGPNIDDELLGLAGDETAPSSPPVEPQSDPVEPEPEAPPSPQGDPFDPEIIVQPSGLTRAEVIRRIEAKEMKGLTEDDVKAVQDEMWLREKNGLAPTNKDGTIRKKPGPAKGWKRMRGIESKRGAHDHYDGQGSDAGDTSVAGETINDEADADIAALLADDGVPTSTTKAKKGKAKAKRRKLDDMLDETTKYAEMSEDEKPYDRSVREEMDEEKSMSVRAQSPGGSSAIDGSAPPIKTKSSNKNRARDRARKARMLQQALDKKAAEEAAAAAAAAAAAELAANTAREPVIQVEDGETPFEFAPDMFSMTTTTYAPNTVDPRGVSEDEARVRLGLVEEIQAQVWGAIVRDVPKIYRVYQGYDTVVKQDCLRKSQAVMRNGHGQKNLKASYKTVNKVNKDAVNKAKRIVKEMLVYWRKNEKEEMALRKKAEKEALEKAKAEEELRESKRQARKLNFLLTQTELYSHFIGKKIKTHEAENVEGMENLNSQHVPKSIQDGHANAELGLDDQGDPLPDIDYDDDDEENLRRHAARGAQAAVQAAKDKAKAFDESRNHNGQSQSATAAMEDDTMDGEELNFQNPSLGEDSVTITQPRMLMAQLKEYQLKGLTWLGNLYEQGINGILADEMGLGKTIQSISLLAYLAEHHNLWGPFLVIAPASTLHNWQQELARFVPRLKALPYWGSPKDRETLRRIWTKKNQTFSEDSPFHILVTSYQLAVQDEKYLQSLKWQYMILDEAQAIKSSSSNRWKSLLSLRCRNRLLLTGTPIQNSMHELWALLHFIMPSLFDSHEEFSEWFSRDIEDAAGGVTGSLKPEQLRRLHMILKPFMLRRVKKHVQKELGDKIEIDLLVDLSQRQRSIYKALRSRVSITDLLAQAASITDTSGAKNLMNLVMQFRKVCNHPDLFERADVISPLLFGTFSNSGNLAREDQTQLYLPYSAKNAIEINLPKILWTDGGKLDRPSENCMAGSDTHLLRNLMNIWNTDWINSRLKEKENGNEFGFLKFINHGVTPSELSRKAKSHPLINLVNGSEESLHKMEDGDLIDDVHFAVSSNKRFSLPPLVPSRISTSKGERIALREISTKEWNTSFLSRPEARFGLDNVIAPLIKPSMSNRSFVNSQESSIQDALVQRALYGLTPSEVNDPTSYTQYSSILPSVPPNGLLASSPISQNPIPPLKIPPTKRLIVDSAKLSRLDSLLRELKAGGHRVLLYFQMTKMMDLIEEYLIFRQYKYLRLDGSSVIGDRRDMVTSWQTNPDIFVFCLSTRAGGLGINLTAADTVIFYDHDWNPSSDAQAMDRAHRVGQTKQVTVYRLIARGTIEERILKMARAKKDVQDIVVGTKSLTDVAKPSEIVSLFMDDEDIAESVAKRKQAEAHGYVAPSITTATNKKSSFGDGLGGGGDDDEDDFFSMSKNNVVNGEDEDYGDEDKSKDPAGGAGGGGEGAAKKKKKPNANGESKAAGEGVGGNKRKAPSGNGNGESKPKKKKVKIALGPDGLPL